MPRTQDAQETAGKPSRILRPPRVGRRPERGTSYAEQPRDAGAGRDRDAQARRARDTRYARWGARALSLAVLAAGAPLALASGALVALLNAVAFRDPRKVLFFQDRVGLDGREFRLVKFRTMRDVDDAFAAWSNGDSRRVTRFGRFLRNAHLDELPQLWNVLVGDMNLVGPRPEMLEIEAWARDAVPGFGRRLQIAPGLTGLAQVTQGYTSRDAAAYRRKLEICEHYLAHRSLALDLKILASTAVWMLRGRGWSWQRQALESADAPAAEDPRPTGSATRRT